MEILTRQPTDDAAVNPNGWVAYPVPLGDGRWARLLLPADLTEADTVRIAKYLNALVNIT